MDVSTAFDGAGWVGCPADTYMNGLYKSDGNALWNIETMNCCGDPGATLTNCEDHDISVSFDIAGTVECPGTKVMTGMYRSGGLNQLRNIETLRCCEYMPAPPPSPPLPPSPP